MSFTPRNYEQIVNDMLTTLTGGTVRETVLVSADSNGLVLQKLRNRPIERVSHLEVFFQDEEGNPQSFRYAASDFELINAEGGLEQPDRIRILEGARQPQVNDSFQVNYYPAQTPPVPLTDVQPGSVTRTLIETFAREMAVTNLHLDHVYHAAFLETATGKSLERVVALLGLKRFPGGFPLVKLRFQRRPNTPGQITIPAGTAVTDANGTRYQTLQALTLDPFETSRDVLAAGETKTTAVVEANQLTFPETVIAGIELVTNPDSAYQITQPESDGDLRQRARQAMLAGVGGTIEALIGGVQAVEGVKNATFTEQPNGYPGEIRLNIVYGDDSDIVKAAVNQRINTLRPAGIRVIVQDQTIEKQIRLLIDLTFAGDGLLGAQKDQLLNSISQDLNSYFEQLAPKSKVRQAQLSAMLLTDARIVDGQVTITDIEGQPLTQPSLQADEIFKVTQIEFGTIETETGAPIGSKITVGGHLVALPEAGFSPEELNSALEKAFESYLSTASQQGSLSVADLLQNMRDDARYALDASQTLITLELGNGQFIQLSDVSPSHSLEANQSLQKGDLSIDLQEEEA